MPPEAWSAVISSGTVAARLKKFQNIQKQENGMPTTPPPARVTTNLFDVTEQGVWTGRGRRTEPSFASPAGRAARDSAEGFRGDHHPPIQGGHGPCILGGSLDETSAFAHLPSRPNTSQGHDAPMVRSESPMNTQESTYNEHSLGEMTDHEWQNQLREARSRLKTVRETPPKEPQSQPEGNRRDQSVFDELEDMIDDALVLQEQVNANDGDPNTPNASLMDKGNQNEDQLGASLAKPVAHRRNSESHPNLSRHLSLSKERTPAAQAEQRLHGRHRSLTTDAVMTKHSTNFDSHDSAANTYRKFKFYGAPIQFNSESPSTDQWSEAVRERPAAFEQLTGHDDQKLYGNEVVDKSSLEDKMKSSTIGQVQDNHGTHRRRTSKLWPFHWSKSQQDKSSDEPGSKVDSRTSCSSATPQETPHGHSRLFNSEDPEYHTHRCHHEVGSGMRGEGDVVRPRTPSERRSLHEPAREVCHDNPDCINESSEWSRDQSRTNAYHCHHRSKASSGPNQSDDTQYSHGNHPTESHHRKDGRYKTEISHSGSRKGISEVVPRSLVNPCGQSKPTREHRHESHGATDGNDIFGDSQDINVAQESIKDKNYVQHPDIYHGADESFKQQTQKEREKETESSVNVVNGPLYPHHHHIKVTKTTAKPKGQLALDFDQHQNGKENPGQDDRQVKEDHLHAAAESPRTTKGRDCDHSKHHVVDHSRPNPPRQQGIKVLERIQKLEQAAAATRPHSSLASRRPNQQALQDTSHEIQTKPYEASLATQPKAEENSIATQSIPEEKFMAPQPRTHSQRRSASQDTGHGVSPERRSSAVGLSRRAQGRQSSSTYSLAGSGVSSPVRRGRALERAFDLEGLSSVRGNSYSVRVEIGISRSPSKRRRTHLELDSVEASGSTHIEEDHDHLITVKADIIPEEDEE